MRSPASGSKRSRSSCVRASPRSCRAARAPSTRSIRVELKEPYYGRRSRVATQLYDSIGIPREDRPGRYRQFSRNYLFYDAPVGLFVSIDRIMGPPQWSDVGGFIQNIMLLARAHGLHSCAAGSLDLLAQDASRPSSGLPPEHILFCGIALGYADEAAPINRWRAEREPVDAFATVSKGFEPHS